MNIKDEFIVKKKKNFIYIYFDISVENKINIARFRIDFIEIIKKKN